MSLESNIPPQQPTPLDERKRLIQSEINRYVGLGYRVVSQTDVTAQMVKPKQFSFICGCLSFFVFGIGLVLYILYYLSKKDDTLYLEVNERGEVLINNLTEAERNAPHPLTGKRFTIFGSSFSLTGLVIYGCLLFVLLSVLVGLINALLSVTR